MPATTAFETLLTREQVAIILGVNRSYLDNLASKRQGPAFIKLAHRCVRYEPAVIRAWIDARKVA
jgi:predicted DNA-binding transcriptional regulator AlpA